MIIVGIIIAIFLFMTMLCTFANYTLLANILKASQNEEELIKKLLRK